MRHLTAGMMCILWAMPALAQEKILYADCGDAGCTCYLTDTTLDAYALVTGEPAPAGAADMVLVSNKGDLIWSRSTPDELDLIAGGDGTCETVLFKIIPEDGTWASSVRVQDIRGCLPQVAEMVPPMVAGIGASRSIVWGGRFDPAKFAIDGAKNAVRWTERNATYFDGTVPVPANPVLDVTATTTATLTAPDKAEATLALRLKAGPGTDAAALAMIGMANCQVDATYDFVRTGP